MKCPKCKNKTETKDSRLQSDNSVRRRRVCRVCGHTVRTTEIEIENNFLTGSMYLIRKANAQKKYTKPQKKILKKRQETVDFDKMTDEELEAWIYNDNEI